MNYHAASRVVSSSVLARHSVLDTPAPYWIRGNPVGPLDTGFRRYDELAARRGVSTLTTLKTTSVSAPAAVYRPRNPQSSDDSPRCVEDYCEICVGIYDEYVSRQYGFWRPSVKQVISRYLECGDLHNGFARVTWKDCGHENLLAFCCTRRHVCPSCPQKRVGEFVPNSPLGVQGRVSRHVLPLLLNEA
jgi:hypothetical protein